MMSQDDWDKLKDQEKYKLVADAFVKSDAALKQCIELSKQTSFLLDQVTRINQLENRIIRLEQTK